MLVHYTIYSDYFHLSTMFSIVFKFEKKSLAKQLCDILWKIFFVSVLLTEEQSQEASNIH